MAGQGGHLLYQHVAACFRQTPKRKHALSDFVKQRTQRRIFIISREQSVSQRRLCGNDIE